MKTSADAQLATDLLHSFFKPFFAHRFGPLLEELKQTYSKFFPYGKFESDIYEPLQADESLIVAYVLEDDFLASDPDRSFEQTRYQLIKIATAYLLQAGRLFSVLDFVEGANSLCEANYWQGVIRVYNSLEVLESQVHLVVRHAIALAGARAKDESGYGLVRAEGKKLFFSLAKERPSGKFSTMGEAAKLINEALKDMRPFVGVNTVKTWIRKWKEESQSVGVLIISTRD